ncbi:MAG TPA: hypothetical protein VL990_01240 [Acidobacteriaceae bacterium]|nr:hypothetical protein [Acidobacteriaceae bacterium]
MVEMKDDFEPELREQLRAREAPAGFADRVMARVAKRQQPQHRGWLGFGMPVWQWAVATLLVAAMVAGGLEREREQREQGARAREQVLLALHITGSTLREVQQKVGASDAVHEMNQKGAGAVIPEKDEP